MNCSSWSAIHLFVPQVKNTQFFKNMVAHCIYSLETNEINYSYIFQTKGVLMKHISLVNKY